LAKGPTLSSFYSVHGRADLQRWVYGSVTSQVLRSANGSLLVIRPVAADLR
jgi:hypothetical protein